MKDKIKQTSKKTTKFLADAWLLVAATATGIAGSGVATKPELKTHLGLIPFWQATAAVIAVSLIGFAWSLVHRRGA